MAKITKSPVTTKVLVTTIHQVATVCGQTKEYSHQCSVNGHKLSIEITHDTSYQTQSRAKISVWTPSGWTTVVHLHSSEVTTDNAPRPAYGTNKLPASVFAAVETVLLTAALAILTA